MVNIGEPSIVQYVQLLVYNLQLREFVEMGESIGVIGTIGISHEVEPSGGCLPHITALRPHTTHSRKTLQTLLFFILPSRYVIIYSSDS